MFFRKQSTIREDLHAHPEIGYELPRTISIVEEYLKKFGINVRTGIGQSGIVGDIFIGENFKTIALRADMDGLEIEELGTSCYKSQYIGKAHLCGHVAMLLGAAKVINRLKNLLKVNVRFIFQPSEERHPSGAKAMIKDGVLEQVDQLYAIHVDPEHNEGCISITKEIASSNTDFFSIKIKGKGAHASSPHLSSDPIVLAAKIILDSQCLISRNIDPFETAVLSFTQIKGGTNNNSIPETVEITGTVRTFSAAVRGFIIERLEKIIKSVCAQEDAEYNFDYIEYCPSVYNHPETSDHAIKVAKALLGHNNVKVLMKPSMGGEDFAYFSEKIPSCIVGLGIRNEKKGIIFDCHSPYFDLHSPSMLHGIMYHAGLVFFQEI